MKRLIKNLGIGVDFTAEVYFKGLWKDYIPFVLDMRRNYSRLPKRFVKHGESQIASIIRDLVEEIT